MPEPLPARYPARRAKTLAAIIVSVLGIVAAGFAGLNGHGGAAPIIVVSSQLAGWLLLMGANAVALIRRAPARAQVPAAVGLGAVTFFLFGESLSIWGLNLVARVSALLLVAPVLAGLLMVTLARAKGRQPAVPPAPAVVPADSYLPPGWVDNGGPCGDPATGAYARNERRLWTGPDRPYRGPLNQGPYNKF